VIVDAGLDTLDTKRRAEGAPASKTLWEVGMPLDLLMILILAILAALSLAYISGLERI
jgi:hypothetical protein